ncbi:hypothetical protein JX265_007052 [Neoarthrinium moseri]|uniref:Uncharacterized protein n=1 Tax=Neoarthrinium moseri TaxID=1658444 RepID=A0A9Q0ANH4_9PEZI|nr:uncharacterized protein JN550_008002 [Neoarthrinium moseri]KAI1844689.1 hypothetical protein JX266_009145 [Neoarthrinium moseri]KAI1866024.1 hypothetical protein JN550_008002 [Neoarthrinium moseri]KAI1868229.1 hypothetical protein JX265_007052 [Neoarthrinium moseri]
MSPQPRVPVVAVGVTRRVAVSVGATVFADTPYDMVAVLDWTESPKELQYSPANLAVVLNALQPRPRALIAGNAVPEELMPELSAVWDEYARRHEIEGAFVGLSRIVGWQPGPPPQEVSDELMRKLKEIFGV